MTKRRPKGEGCITRLPSGNFKMTITIGKDLKGRQIRRSVTASTKKELMEKASQLRLQKGLIIKSKKITFEAYLKKYMELKELSLNATTYKVYISILHRYDVFKDVLIENITPDMIQQWIVDLSKRYKASTVSITKTFLKTVLDSAVEDGYISKVPFKKTLSVPKGSKRVDLPLPTKDELKGFFKAHKEDKEVILFVLIAISTGMRKGEILGLKWSNIDFKEHKIKVCSQYNFLGYSEILKTKSSYRIISVAPSVLDEIEKIHKDNEYIFKSPTRIAERVKKALKVISKDYTIHSLRHYHATQLISKGVNVKVVSQRLGHSNIGITLNTYVHWLPNLDKEASLMLGKDEFFKC